MIPNSRMKMAKANEIISRYRNTLPRTRQMKKPVCIARRRRGVKRRGCARFHPCRPDRAGPGEAGGERLALWENADPDISSYDKPRPSTGSGHHSFLMPSGAAMKEDRELQNTPSSTRIHAVDQTHNLFAMEAI
jgi:hypothetical protein